MKKVEAAKNGSAVVPPRSPASAKKPPSPILTPFVDLVEDDHVSLVKIMDDPRYQGEIRQWSEDNSSDLRKLMRRFEVVQWLYQNNRIDNKKWEFLIDELVAGRLGNLLKLKTNLCIVLWHKLCHYLVERPAELKQCSVNKDFLSGFLWHASLEQRMTCFAEADQAMTENLFELCGHVIPLRHVLYSVLCHCFARIRNEDFFVKLLSSAPFLFEFALAASSPDVLSDFEREYQDKEWFKQYKQRKSAYSKCRAEITAEDKVFTENDQVRILRYLRSILGDKEETKLLSDGLMVSYFRMNNADIFLALFANPVLCERLVDLHRAQKIVIDCQDHIFPLMQWMMEKQKEDPGAAAWRHLLNSETMGHYCIASVELLFAHYCQEEQDKQFLEQFFECFGSAFFSGVTIEQLKGLQSIRGGSEVILGGYAVGSSDKVDSYRVLGDVGEEGIYSRWKATSKDTQRFIEQFQYKGPADVERWMKLLLCEWKGDLNEKDIIDLIVEHCVQLRFADFLKEIKGTRSLDQLFSRRIMAEGVLQVYLAKKIVGVQNIFGRCGFGLDDFKSWKPVLLVGILANPVWHNAYGFSPIDFYRLIREDRDKALFSIEEKKEGFLDRLLTHSNLDKNDSQRARIYLVNILLNAPADVQRVIQEWLRGRVRKILLKAVDEDARAMGIEQHQFVAMMRSQSGLSPRRKSLVTLHHYLTNPSIYLAEDFLEVLSQDKICKELVKEILAKAPRCVQDLISKGPSLAVAARAKKPWCADGKPYKQYPHQQAFNLVEKKLKAEELKLNNNKTTEQALAFIKTVWHENCLFILALLEDKGVKNALKDDSVAMKKEAASTMGQVAVVSTMEKVDAYLKEVDEILSSSVICKEVNPNPRSLSGFYRKFCNMLNTNQLVRRAGIMLNPIWLEKALTYSLFHFPEGNYPLHAELVGTYAQLPEFVIVTQNLHPCHLINSLTTDLVSARPRQMVEYLIDLCHFVYSGEEQIIIERAKLLVDIGIESFFRKLPIKALDQMEREKWKHKRFICLCVSAGEFLPLQQWDGLFERNEALLTRLCQWLAEYDLVTMPAAKVPAFVRLQMIVLRNLSKQLELPVKPTEAQIQAKHAAQKSIHQILWQMSCVPGAVPGKIKVQDCLDEASLRRMDYLEVRTQLAHVLADVQPAARLQEPPRKVGPNF